MNNIICNSANQDALCSLISMANTTGKITIAQHMGAQTYCRSVEHRRQFHPGLFFAAALGILDYVFSALA